MKRTFISVTSLPYSLPIRKGNKDARLICKQNVLLGDEGTPEVHASTLLPLENGRILAAWFGGTEEKHPDVRIWYSIRDEYGYWAKPLSIPSEENVAHWNPVLDRKNDGSIRLYFKKGAVIPDWQTFYCDSFDEGKTFSQPKELVPDDVSGGRGPVKNKCLRTKSGLLLAPASNEQNKDWRVFIDVSHDDGDTWQRGDYIEMTNGRGKHVKAIQPTLWETFEQVHFMCRTKGGFIYRSDSDDGGLTWCAGYRTPVVNNNSGIDCVRSDDGRLWLLCNPISDPSLRSPLRMLMSVNNGRSWRAMLDLETERHGEFSYPAIVCKGNKLYCTYTNDRKNITFAEIEIS